MVCFDINSGEVCNSHVARPQTDGRDSVFEEPVFKMSFLLRGLPLLWSPRFFCSAAPAALRLLFG